MVDSIYVSQISESAVTALSLAFPIQNLQIGFAVGIGVGINSLLSKSLGERDQEAANRTAGNGFVLMFLCTAAFMLFGMFGVRPYYEMQSTVAETVEGGIAYTRICCLFILGSFMQIYCERLLQSTGRTVLSMITQGVGAITNIILDPIFIFGWFGLPAMGMAGAAIATVIGQWTGAVLGLYFNLKRNHDVQFGRRYVKLDGKIVNQSDIASWKGMANEAVTDNAAHPEDPTAWTNSMFGGMPTTATIDSFDGDWTDAIYDFFLTGKRPASYLLLALIGGFLLMLSLGTSKVMAVAGAIAIAFCSYNMQIIQVGHNTKMQAIAYFPWVLAGVIFTYRAAMRSFAKKSHWLPQTILGATLFAFALSMQIKANHPQITYYLAIVIIQARCIWCGPRYYRLTL